MSKDTERKVQDSPEVSEKASRRRFTVEYKARILEEADQVCASLLDDGEYLYHAADDRG